ncbi:MAG: replication-associated recombination protein A [Pseudomonadota bacterium]|nr:replication-associated recombination protein A [Pseudomonadota bacterium]
MEFSETLFNRNPSRPLADRVRPGSFSDVVGQDHLLEPNGSIGSMIRAKKIASIILWGPPGSGKTTIARLLADLNDHNFLSISAIYSGVADLKKIFQNARRDRKIGGETILFVDEIHRFNRVQQDGFLPFIEDGTITLIGATTENPSFQLTPPLLSRAQIVVLHRLDDESLEKLLLRAEVESGRKLPIDEDARADLLGMADGDGRYLLNVAESILLIPENKVLDRAGLAEIAQRRAPLYDRGQDNHYNLISALHKSLRSSDADASLYWLARMLVAGEDPIFLLRRLVRFSSEDIGMADPNALLQALAGWDSFIRLGSPEGELAIAQVVLYLASAPKSNSVYRAFSAATAAARNTGSLMPPKKILNAPTNLMKDLGYGEGYQYDHDTPEGFSGQNCFPDGMKRKKFYEPVDLGFEQEIKKRLKQWENLRGASENE